MKYNNKFNLQLFADDEQGAKTPNDNGSTPPPIDYESEYNKLLAERDSIKADVDKYKKLKDQYASENAEYKKKEIAKMSDEEKKQKEFQELVDAKNKMEAELKTMKLEKDLLGNGFTSEESAKLIKANISIDDMKVLSDIIKEKVDLAVKSAKAEGIKTSTPDSLMGNGTADGKSVKTGFQKYQESQSQPKYKVEI